MDMEITREDLMESLGLNKDNLSYSNLETTSYSFEDKEAVEESKKVIKNDLLVKIDNLFDRLSPKQLFYVLQEKEMPKNHCAFSDYDIRVWGDDVFIFGHNKLNYWSGNECMGLQCNFEEGDSRYQEIRSLCDEIRQKMLQLNELVK